MRKNCKNFEEWVDSQYEEYATTSKNAKYLRVSTSFDHNSWHCFIFNIRNGESGFAAIKADHFDIPPKVAAALAWANYKNEEVPDFKVPLCRLTTSDKFIYNGKEYRYLTSNPYSTDNVIICDSYGKPSNLHKLTRVTPC